MKLIEKMAVSLAALGLIIPQTDVSAANSHPSTDEAGQAKVEAPEVKDVSLRTGGTFTGQLVNDQGDGLSNTEVTLMRGEEVVGQATTNEDGFFSMTQIRGGTYELVAGNSHEYYRLWAPNTAPPTAMDQTVIVDNGEIVRGQFYGMDFVTATVLVGAIAGVTLGVIALDELNDIEDKVDAIPTSP